MTEVETKRILVKCLKEAAHFFTDSPSFDKPEILAAWGRALFPHFEAVMPVLGKLPTRFKRWPSIRDILEVAGCAEPTEQDLVRSAVNSVWAYLDNVGELTPLGERIFDSLGGWEKLGQAKMSDQTRGQYTSMFWERGKKLMGESEQNALPRVDVPALPPSDIDKTAEDYLKKKMSETHREVFSETLACDEPYEERKRKAQDAGLDYWEPPRSWEIDRPLTVEERRLWNRKINMRLGKEVLKEEAVSENV